MIVRRLNERELPIVAMAQVSRTLEDVYLKIVTEDEAEVHEHKQMPASVEALKH
jgi:hypothetical protein